MLPINIINGPQFDYIQKGNPTIDVNPTTLYATWLNIDSGELFICTNNSRDDNVWAGQNGTLVFHDMYYDYVKLLLPFFGDDSGTDFKDYTPNPNSLTVSGTFTTVVVESKFYGSSMYHSNAGGEYIETAGSLDFSGDFCLEAWSKCLGTGAEADIIFNLAGNANGAQLNLEVNTDDASVGLYLDDGGGATSYQSGLGDLSLGEWHHICVTRVGNIFTTYLDGTAVKAVDFSITLGLEKVRVGGDQTSIHPYYGYLQDLRVTIGSGRYPTDFIPPTKLITSVYEYRI